MLTAADPAPSPEAIKAKETALRGRQDHAEIIRRIADEEFRASDPQLDAATRKQATEIAQLARTAEQLSRPDGLNRAQEFGLLNKLGVADQSVADAKIEANAYSLVSSLKRSLLMMPDPKDAGARTVAQPAHLFFGQELATYAATLSADGRRAQLRAWIGERLPRLPQDSSLADTKTLSEIYDLEFSALTELLGDAIAGLEAAELLVQLEGYKAETHARHAEMLARNGRRDSALRALDVALALDPKNGRALKWEKQLSDLAPELYTGVVEEPADQTTLAMVGTMSLIGQELHGQQLLAAEASARTLARRLLAALRAPAERRDTALRQAVALHESMKGILLNPTKTRFFDAAGKLDGAKTPWDAKKVFETMPLEAATHPLYWQARAKSYLLDRNLRPILDCISVMQALDPENAWAKKNRPTIEGMLAQAAAPAPAPVRPAAKEEHSAFYQTTVATLARGDFVAAEAAIAAALATNRRDVEALLLQAQAKQERGDAPGAEAALTDALLTGGPNLAEANGKMSLLRQAQGRMQDAAYNAKKALELAPDQPEALVALAKFDVQQNNLPAAFDKLGRAVAVRPDYEVAISMTAMLLGQTGKSAQAMQMLQSALAKNPESAPLHSMLAVQYLMTGKPDLMRAELAVITKLKHPLAPLMVTQLSAALKAYEAKMTPTPASPVPAAPSQKK